MDGPWWLVGLCIVALYYGWRAYLHHRWPVDKDMEL